jgi:uncharacterized protein (DUF58 family)
LFLLGYWIFALLVVSLAYAAWNGGISVRVGVVGTESDEGSPVEDLPEGILAGRPRVPVFEGDRMKVRIKFVSRHGTRGPARVSGWFGGTEFSAAAGRVPKEGWSELRVLGPLRRGPVAARDWATERGDPLGFFNHRNKGMDFELTLVLPRFKALAKRPNVRELEASVAAPRAGSGTEMFGVREYRPGDPLRRIHWRSSARHGELIVREFEPPGVQTLGIFCDPSPPTPEVADQIARLAASEAWDCLRAGGRVVLWTPGAEPSLPSDSRSLWALLEWLARYPGLPATRGGPAAAGGRGGDPDQTPRVGDAIAVMATANPEIDDALATIRHRGGAVRAWVVGDADVGLDMNVQRAGLEWPLP